MYGITPIFITVIIFLTPPIYFDFSMWKTFPPSSSATGKLHEAQTSGFCSCRALRSAEAPCRMLVSIQPQSYLSCSTEITAGSDAWSKGPKLASFCLSWWKRACCAGTAWLGLKTLLTDQTHITLWCGKTHLPSSCLEQEPLQTVEHQDTADQILKWARQQQKHQTFLGLYA